MELMPEVEIPDEKDQRFSVLSYEQVKRLNDLMSETIPIHGRGNFPTIDVKLSHLVNVVKQKLEVLEAAAGVMGYGLETANKYKIKNVLGQVSNKKRNS